MREDRLVSSSLMVCFVLLAFMFICIPLAMIDIDKRYQFMKSRAQKMGGNVIWINQGKDPILHMPDGRNFFYEDFKHE